MKKCFKYRIEANKQTLQKAIYWLDLCRNLYNTALEQRRYLWNQRRYPISYREQQNQLPALKQEFPEYYEVNSQVLQDVLQRLDKTFKAFFRRIKKGEKPGFPRFKSKNRYNSFTLKQHGWKLDDKYLIITNIGRFKIRFSRSIEGNIKTITIKRTRTDKWFVLFNCDNVPKKPLSKTGKEIGIDVGLKSFLTTSEGIKINNPRFFNNTYNILLRRQRILSQKKKGSKRWEKARILVAKAYEKIANQRRDFHFKLANQLIREYDNIYIEDMNAWNTNNRNLNREMRDVSWFGFFTILAFKAEEAGKRVVKVPAKDTSQLCSNCGTKVSKDISVRIHSCPYCGLVLDRDHNAALNILRLGQSLQVYQKSITPENLIT